VAASSRSHDGIRHAKAAGMSIDPRAERYMADAPAGSCANDPTQRKCGRIHAVVFDGGPTFARPLGAAATVKTLIDQCRVNITDQSPYKAAGYAQADGANYCTAAVTWQELYVILRKYYAGKWWNMASRMKHAPGGQTIRVHTVYDCTDNPYRAWHARAEGYALLQGVLYLAVENSYHNLYCG
jgi:hypothetical protein